MAIKSGMLLDKNTAAALSYVLGPVTGVFFLLVSKDSYVRFHAAQSIVVFSILIVLQGFFGLTEISRPLVPLVSILTFLLWLILIYKSWLGSEWEVPVLGSYARKLLGKVSSRI